MNASIATIAGSHASMAVSQGTLIEKLSTLEKAVATHQFDMTRVRADMKAVHCTMEKLASHVSDLGDSNAELVLLRGLAGDERAPEEPWKGPGLVEEGCIDEPRSTPQASRACTAEEPIEKIPDTFTDCGDIGETQNHTQYAERLTTIAASPEEEGVSDWEAEYAAALGQSHPRGIMPRPDSHDDVAEEESQQLALSCPSAQPRTPSSGTKMWTDFKTVVTKWPAPAAEGNGRPDGWVSAKRGRGTSPECEEDMMETANGTFVDDSPTLNLNEPPEKHALNATGRGRGAVPGNSGALNNKRGGRGSGRGTARGRRPAPVQPRFHAMVRGKGWVALLELQIRELKSFVVAPSSCSHIVNLCIPFFVLQQRLVEEGTECYILCPGNGIRPVAEGIAGRAPIQLDPESPIDDSYMKMLFEDGTQHVTVTGVYKKNVELMYVDRTSNKRFLDDVLTPPAAPGTTAIWCVRYLVPKEDEMP